ncbi:MAG: DUF547 domain-containing protein [Gammaproteobacteria bacterium]|nr:DUF547 domain-containing protein [Gammaproteobacteria bacterium]
MHGFTTRCRRSLWLLVAALALPALATAAGPPDYTLFDDVLTPNVNKGYVDYDGIAANPRFGRFLTALAEAPRPANRDEELALLINAYNAFAISGILQGYSPSSRLGRWRFFERLEFTLSGEPITLEDLEHKRLRTLGEPRIHFAIVCASLSCPRLASRAYRPETLDRDLDAATRGFVNDVTRNHYDIAQRTAFLSSIFDWFRGDFETGGSTLPSFLARYVQDPAVRAALLEGRLAIRHLDYDWGLNGRFSGNND